MASFESELSIENQLIHQLTKEKSQWTLREDIHTFQDLWNNFRGILVRNNKELFDEHPLTDNEFLQVQTSCASLLFMMGRSGCWGRMALLA